MQSELSERRLQKLKLSFEENLYIFSDSIKDQLFHFTDYKTINLKEIFKDDNILNVEIGIGNGEFLVHLAENYPDENFLGFEVVKRVFKKAVARIKRNRLENVRLVHYDGSFFVNLLPEKSVSNFYINFPDPWPKKKHHKRRLLKTPFLKLLARKLKNNGTLYMVTDHENYAKEIMTNLIPVDDLTSAFKSVYVNELVDYYPTKYYRKFASSGSVFFFKMKKL